MQRAGVSSTTKVVAYDDAGGSIAARLWFLLGWFGHPAQAVLDGGLQAWAGPLTSVLPEPGRGAFRAIEPDPARVDQVSAPVARDAARVGPLLPRHAGGGRLMAFGPLVDSAWLSGHVLDPEVRVIDFRWYLLERDGREEYLRGHIPGAVSSPWKGNLSATGRFRPPAELRKMYEDLGVAGGAVMYCGSGVNACHNLLAMEIAGLSGARLYAGSWSDWASHEAPVATGKEP